VTNIGQRRDIPRIWEVDWAIPPVEGGTRWESYEWLLDMAADLGSHEVSVIGGTYEVLGRLDLALGGFEAERLRVGPHSYRVRGLTVHGITRRGFWHTRGPVLVAWARDEHLTEVEGQKPPAIAAVAQWPHDIGTWYSVYKPERIGQERPQQEANFALPVAPYLDARAANAIEDAALWVNEAHSILDTDERENMVGALIALRNASIPVDREGVRGFLMARGWNGGVISDVLDLAARVSVGWTPHHRTVRLDAERPRDR